MSRLMPFLFIAAIILSTTSLHAADYDFSTVRSEGCRTCFRGDNNPDCCASLILETFYRFRTAGSELGRFEDNDPAAGLNFGLMKRLGPSTALGGALYINFVNGGKVGLVPRFRTWLDPMTPLDIKAGILVTAGDDYHRFQRPGFVGGIGLSLADLISIDLMVEWYRYDQRIWGSSPGVEEWQEVNRTDLYVGVSGRSYVAWVMPVVLAAYHIITFEDETVF